MAVALVYTGGTSLTYSSGVATVSANLSGASLLIVSLSNSYGTVTGITYNGVALTRYTSADYTYTSGMIASVWYLLSPASGTNNIAITGGAGDSTVQILGFTGNHASTPIRTYSQNNPDVENFAADHHTSLTALATDGLLAITHTWWSSVYTPNPTSGYTGYCYSKAPPANTPGNVDSYAYYKTPGSSGSVTFTYDYSGAFCESLITFMAIQPAAGASDQDIAGENVDLSLSLDSAMVVRGHMLTLTTDVVMTMTMGTAAVTHPLFIDGVEVALTLSVDTAVVVQGQILNLTTPVTMTLSADTGNVSHNLFLDGSNVDLTLTAENAFVTHPMFIDGADVGMTLDVVPSGGEVYQGLHLFLSSVDMTLSVDTAAMMYNQFITGDDITTTVSFGSANVSHDLYMSLDATVAMAITADNAFVSKGLNLYAPNVSMAITTGSAVVSYSQPIVGVEIAAILSVGEGRIGHVQQITGSAIEATLQIANAGVTRNFVSPLTIAPGQSVVLKVAFIPSLPGLRTGTLRATSNAVGSPHTVLLSGHATGISENNIAAPAVEMSFSFGSAGVAVAAPPVLSYLTADGAKLRDEVGRQVMLRSVNWYGFEQAYMPHGLWERPYKTITVDGVVQEGILDMVKRLGFNSIRLLFCQDNTDPTVTVNTPNGLMDTYTNPQLNPDLMINPTNAEWWTMIVMPQAVIPSIQVMDKIVAYCGEIGLRIILDMHCLAADDNNVLATNGKWYTTATPGTAGSTSYMMRSPRSEAQAIAAWVFMASRYANNPVVCGADIINEPWNCTWDDDPNTGLPAYYERVGAAIQAVNPDILIICEGITGNVNHCPPGLEADYENTNGFYEWGTIWSGKLDQVRARPVVLPVPNKVVYSPHEYGSYLDGAGVDGIAHQWFNPEDTMPYYGGIAFPNNMFEVWRRQWGWMAEENFAPVWIGEYGSNLQTGGVDWFVVGAGGVITHQPFDTEYTVIHRDLDFQWINKLAEYCNTHHIGHAWWSLNPGTIGGVVQMDWKTLLDFKYTPHLLNKFVFPNGPFTAPIGLGAPQGIAGSAVSMSMTMGDATVVPTSSSLALRTSGVQTIDANGVPFRLKSINWYGFNSDTRSPHGLWGGGLNWEYSIETMRDMGFNSLRIPFSYAFASNISTLPIGTFPGGAPVIDYDLNPNLAGKTAHQVFRMILDKCATLGLRVIIDMHQHNEILPGGLLDGNPLEGGITVQTWINRWKVMVNEYGDHPALVGCELYNEPWTLTWDAWANMFENCANQLHEIAPHLLMLAQGVGNADNPSEQWMWGQNLTGAVARPITLTVPNRLVYAPHDYGQITHDYLGLNFPWLKSSTQDVVGYPNNLFAFFRYAWGHILVNRTAPVWLSEFGGAFGGYADTMVADPVTWPSYAYELQWLDALTRFLDGEYYGDGMNHLLSGEEGAGFAYWCFNGGGGDNPFGIMTDDWKINLPKRDTLDPMLGAYVAPPPVERPLPVAGWYMVLPAGITGTYIEETRTVSSLPVVGYKIVLTGTTSASGMILATMTQIDAVMGDNVELTFAAVVDVDSPAITEIFTQVTEISSVNTWLTANGTDWHASRMTLGAKGHTRLLTNASTAHAKGEIYTNTIPPGTVVNLTMWIGERLLHTV